MLNFYLPDFYLKNSYKVNKYFIDLIHNKSHKIFENINIGAIYGAFPCQKWNGGRYFGEPDFNVISMEEVSNVIKLYEELNIPIRFTYTNSLLEEKHLYDSYCNKITELANNGNNEIIVNSPLLEEYLRNNYPEYKFISSTTKCLLNKDDIINEIDKYYLTVLDYRFNNNFEFLKTLPQPDKYEILLSTICGEKCAQRKEHYELMSKFQLLDGFGPSKELLKIFQHSSKSDCKKNIYEAKQTSKAFIAQEDLYSKYVNLGFKNFKIEGRYEPIYLVIEIYLYYMVKPEYRDEVRLDCLKLVF